MTRIATPFPSNQPITSKKPALFDSTNVDCQSIGAGFGFLLDICVVKNTYPALQQLSPVRTETCHYRNSAIILSLS